MFIPKEALSGCLFFVFFLSIPEKSAFLEKTVCVAGIFVKMPKISIEIEYSFVYNVCVAVSSTAFQERSNII